MTVKIPLRQAFDGELLSDVLTGATAERRMTQDLAAPLIHDTEALEGQGVGCCHHGPGCFRSSEAQFKLEQTEAWESGRGTSTLEVGGHTDPECARVLDALRLPMLGRVRGSALHPQAYRCSPSLCTASTDSSLLQVTASTPIAHRRGHLAAGASGGCFRASLTAVLLPRLEQSTT